MDFNRVINDLDAFMARDPAARSRWEVAILYQGFHAVVFYRVSHALWIRDWRFLGRLISQIGRFLTGIEIHPGATIGAGFVIDHGAGVVVGETAVIGDDVTLYHDVTLGGVAPSIDSTEQIGVKRHPTLENDVIVGCGASILGDITVGEGARVGANAVVAKDIPPGVTAVGNPANVVMPKDKTKQRQFQQYGTTVEGIPDPILQTIEGLRTQIVQLKDRVGDLEDELHQANQVTDEDGANDRDAGSAA